MFRPGNAATPLTAFTVSVPPSTPPGPALFAIARVIAFVALVTTFPDESSTLTCTAGVIEAVTATLEGCTVNATFAAEGVTVTVAAFRTQGGWTALAAVQLA